MAPFVNRFRKFMNNRCNDERIRRQSSKRKEEIRCYKCGTKDNLFVDCPHSDENDKKEKKNVKIRKISDI